MGNLLNYIKYHIMQFSWPVSVGIIDVVQILLIAVFVYYLMTVSGAIELPAESFDKF